MRLHQRNVFLISNIYHILYSAGVDPVTISKRLGYAAVSTTTDIYSHIMKKADEVAASKLDNVFGKVINI